MTYQVMPALSDEEYAQLREDIQLRGVCVPIEKDEMGNVLDGHHRLRICEELGITDYPILIRAGLSEDEKFEHALALNIHRRQLSREQRQALHLKLKQRGWSNRKIADVTGADEGTVRNDLTSTAEFSAVPLPSMTVGKDGKRRPARRTVFTSTPGDEKLAQHVLSAERESESPAETFKDAVKDFLQNEVQESAREFEEATASWTPEMRQAYDGDMLAERGAFSRLVRDLSRLPEPRQFVKTQGPYIRPEVVKTATDALRWLTTFLIEMEKR